MRTLTRFGLFGGVATLVLALSKVHAACVADTLCSWHTSSRFAWLISYIVVLIVAAYVAGLPDLPHRPRRSFLAAVGVALIAAGSVSFARLATGDALLPRFVAFGTAVAFVPWAVVCTAAAGSGRHARLGRDRLLFVGSANAATKLTDNLEQVPERPATLADHLTRHARLKRLIDVPLALVGMVASVESIAFVVIDSLMGNRGPLSYRQQQVGKEDVVFTILKFRTMLPHAGEWSRTTADADRMTRFGGLLRHWHIDEVRQMWNILRGDVAVVGPRPGQPRYAAELSEKLPFYDLRHTVHPGPTG